MYLPHRNRVAWLHRWFVANTLMSGVFAAIWLLSRSASKPSRLTYPCQQAAIATMIAAFGAPAFGALLVLRKALIAFRSQPIARASVVGGLAVVLCMAGWAIHSMQAPAVIVLPPQQPPADYTAQLYVMDDAGGPDGQHYQGLDDLIVWMGANGLKFYRSTNVISLESGPAGIISADDIVVVKINYQWDQRGGTNVDLLRGLLRRLLDHPEGFSGEIVVCENAQFNSVNGFDRANNNAENPGLSPHDVVVEYQGEGRKVSHFDWTAVRQVSVGEYASGDLNDGYVVLPYDALLQGRISYPKFQSAYGTRISIRYGVWNPATSAYDRSHLKFINVPVLKSHHATYGVTACVKNNMGVVTGALSTNSHNAIRYGLLGALLGEIQLADLNILDCIWVNANPYSGPATSYAGATRIDKLVAAVDPVAADIWATKYVLIPAFLSNGYTPPWPAPSADPDNPESAFRVYMDNSINRILASGETVTNDLARISANRWNGDLGTPADIDGDGMVDGRDVQPFLDALMGVNPDPLQTLRSDLNEDRELGPDDVWRFVEILLAP